MIAFFKGVWAFLASIPYYVWVIVALGGALGWEHGAHLAAKVEANRLTIWQLQVVNATTAALFQPYDGTVPRIPPEQVVPAIAAAGQSLRDYRAATATANAGIAAVAANGLERRSESHTQALAYDDTAHALQASLDALRKTPPPSSAETDSVEAVTLGRLEWANLR